MRGIDRLDRMTLTPSRIVGSMPSLVAERRSSSVRRRLLAVRSCMDGVAEQKDESVVTASERIGGRASKNPGGWRIRQGIGRFRRSSVAVSGVSCAPSRDGARRSTDRSVGRGRWIYATLGHTGLLVSRLCFGTMTFGGWDGIFSAIGNQGQRRGGWPGEGVDRQRDQLL